MARLKRSWLSSTTRLVLPEVAEKLPMKTNGCDRPVALSIKQPWATLVVHGIKTIEIRSWATPRRGTIYIHAGKIPDDRDHGWQILPDAIRGETEFLGGIIGSVSIADCKSYESSVAFSADMKHHWNLPEWFRPALHGFVFERPTSIPFIPCPGNLRFFRVANFLETPSEPKG